MVSYSFSEFKGYIFSEFLKTIKAPTSLSGVYHFSEHKALRIPKKDSMQALKVPNFLAKRLLNFRMHLVRVAPDCNRSYCEDSFSGYSGSV